MTGSGKSPRLAPQSALGQPIQQLTLKEIPMKFTIPKVMWCICTLLASMIVPANAAVQENDTTEINLTIFIPCAAGGAGELWTLPALYTP